MDKFGTADKQPVMDDSSDEFYQAPKNPDGLDRDEEPHINLFPTYIKESPSKPGMRGEDEISKIAFCRSFSLGSKV